MRKPNSVTKSFTFEGKRYFVNAPTEKEAIVKMVNKKRDLMDSSRVVDSSITLAEWSDICISTYKSNLTGRSLYNYQNRMKNLVVSYLGYMRLQSIKPLDCQACINRQIGKSAWTIKQVKQLLVFLFDKAIQNGLMVSNPAAYLTLPKGTKQVRRALTERERQVFLEASAKDRKYLVFLLTYYCGCRPTEAMSVMGSDILLINGTPYLWIRGTKSSNANRKVPIPSNLYSLIKNTPKSKNIALSTVGKPLTEKQRQLYWSSLKRDMNILMGCKVYRNALVPPYPLDDDLCHYCLRHDYATRLARAVPIVQAKYLLGHGDISVTSNIYQHISEVDIDVESVFSCS